MWELAADELDRIAPKTEGDVLIFMPGKVRDQPYHLRHRRLAGRRVDLSVLPLHGELPPAEQDAALAPNEKRKAIVATNVAETSLTIDGVRVVIDSGLARIARFDPRRGINTLLVEKISRASADQRAGRAGRTAPGSLSAPLDRTGASRTRATGTARGKAARSRRGRADSEGERSRRDLRLPLARTARSASARASRTTAGRSWRNNRLENYRR